MIDFGSFQVQLGHERFFNEYAQLAKANKQIAEKTKRVIKQVVAGDLQHPSLNTRRIEGNKDSRFKYVDITDKYRMVIAYEREIVYFYSVGNHDETLKAGERASLNAHAKYSKIALNTSTAMTKPTVIEEVLLPDLEQVQSDSLPSIAKNREKLYDLFEGDVLSTLNGYEAGLLEDWMIFLAPSQHRAVERSLQGAFKVTGGPGTGKSVVALHAVRYKEAIDKYIGENNYANVSALVAFSGKVIDDGDSFTEAGMNDFPDGETAERFDTNEYQVLIVAEKFQTGFDQPLLHTMYVDKVLSGLNAVQTLSRLNRIHPEKNDTFVLDFRNETDDIQKAFAPWFERTEATPTDPNLLWDTHRDLMAHEVIHADEIVGAVAELLTGKGVDNHARVYGKLDSALTRFEGLDGDAQSEFRDLLGRFVSLYGFVAQIVAFTDANLERDYVYARALQARLPGQDNERIDIGSEVALTHLRTEKTGTGSAALEGGDGTISAIFSGKGKQHDPDSEHLSTIIEALNEKFGMNLNEQDQLLFDQFEQTWVTNPEVMAQARNNEFENFRLVFDRMFLETVVGRMDDNETIFKRVLDDAEFQKTLMDLYANRVYQRLNEG